jgi:HK97 family phage prohead protease
MEKELRSLVIETRAYEGEDGKRYLEGRPIVYGKESSTITALDRNSGQLKNFREVIEPGALRSVLQREGLNVRANWMHSRSSLLADMKSGTLFLEEDEVGVKMRMEVPNTTLGNDVYELVKRGIVNSMSFEFALGSKEDEAWTRNSAGEPLRKIRNIGNLFAVTFADEGAYPDTSTSVALRSLQEFEDSEIEIIEGGDERTEKDVLIEYHDVINMI